MANKPLVSVQFPGLDPKYTVPQIDDTLSVAGKAADSKKTGDEIGNLKQEFNQSVNDIYYGVVFNSTDFEKGGLTSGGENDSYRNECRARNKKIVSYPFDILVYVIASACVFSVHSYQADGTHVADTGWKTSYLIPKNTYFRMSIDASYQQTPVSQTEAQILAKIFESSTSLVSTPFVNVKQYGAVGDGLTDDTNAIQQALECVKASGGTVYIPSGVYLINTPKFNTSDSGIASALHIYSNTKLLLDQNAKLLCGDSITHLLYTHNENNATGYTGCENITIEGGIFDKGNVEDVNCTPVNVSHGNNILIENVRFINSKGVWHYLEINGSNNVKVINCKFIGGANNEDLQIDAALSGSGTLGSADGTVCANIEICGCYFNTSYHPAIGNHTEAEHHNIKIHDCIFYNAGSLRGAISFDTGTTKVDVYNNTFYENTYALNLESEDTTTLFHDNRLEDVTTPYVNCTAYNNIIDGVFEAVGS